MPLTPSQANRVFAALILLSLLFANEWVLGLLFANDGEVVGTKLWLIRGFDVAAIGVAGMLLFTRHSVGSLYRDTALIAFNIVMVMLVLNIAAYALIGHPAEKLFIGSLELLWQNPERMHEVYGTEDDAEIIGRIYSPGAAAHPSLQTMMRPSVGKYYNSGPEGSRVSCSDGQAIDAPLDGAIWMFGGSTTYGTAVSDCETVASALNQLDPANTYVNFGVESRNQNPEIDHLMLLLRKGYRPKAVIFMDGLNDIAINALQAPGFDLHEVPTVTDQPYYFSLINDESRMLANAVTRLPIMQLLASRGADHRAIEECGLDDGGIYTPGSDFHERPQLHHQRQAAFRASITDAESELVKPGAYRSCAQRVLTLYRDNDRFLGKIAKAFGFEYRVFFQPLTSLMPGNPFLHTEAFEKSALKALLIHIQSAVRTEIAAGNLPGFTDISGLHADCRNCAIDANHYTPAYGREIAQAMLADFPNP